MLRELEVTLGIAIKIQSTSAIFDRPLVQVVAQISTDGSLFNIFPSNMK